VWHPVDSVCSTVYYGSTATDTDLRLELLDVGSISPRIVGLRPCCLVIEGGVVVERRKHRGYRNSSVARDHRNEGEEYRSQLWFISALKWSHASRLDLGFLTGMWYVWQWNAV